jgi:glutamate carboxypeptidase
VDRSMLVAAMSARLPAILADIETLVRCESPSSVRDAVARSADLVAAVGQQHLGTAPELIVIDGCPHLRWRFGTGLSSPGGTASKHGGLPPPVPPGPRTPRGRVLILAHHDTVWPLGSIETHPFSVADGVLRGPGCFDMKAGLVLALHALAVLGVPDGVTLLVTGDEELGSPSSRGLIEAEAAGCLAALVLEASADGGALKTARKGVSLYQVRAVGRAAHAGLEPQRGVNATVELAHQVLTVAGLADAALGTTVTPTALSSGTVANTVPSVAAELGLAPLQSASVGGASDGNFTAGVGTPTLDGLGAVGGGAHADHEHVLVDATEGHA